MRMKKQMKKDNQKTKKVHRENLIFKMKEKNQTWNKKKKEKIVCVFFEMNFFLHPKIMKAG